MRNLLIDSYCPNAPLKSLEDGWLKSISFFNLYDGFVVVVTPKPSVNACPSFGNLPYIPWFSPYVLNVLSNISIPTGEPSTVLIANG